MKHIPWLIRLHNLSWSHMWDDMEATSQQLFSDAQDLVYLHSYICINYTLVNGIEGKRSSYFTNLMGNETCMLLHNMEKISIVKRFHIISCKTVYNDGFSGFEIGLSDQFLHSISTFQQCVWKNEFCNFCFRMEKE